MARPSKQTSRPYGRQAKGKTIKSLSIESDILKKAEAQAKEKGMNFSEYITTLIKAALLAFIGYHLFRSGPDGISKALASAARAGIQFFKT
ncbi:MAG: hypothetical protein JWL81_1031 [Verrucomicrobiales bacterium]|nr:hypothetical protein [Verrucomicrobiales bacterium]